MESVMSSVSLLRVRRVNFPSGRRDTSSKFCQANALRLLPQSHLFLS